ncbi:anion transporter [Corallococcus interemptor]|uniref:Anion transporter n=1 Tax=Corallococcus interemptor TaxID=2316720 RepID=A0A3A8Q3G3_9BACT|nr:anion transporter [Corallococcus interemptor]RKH63289.1 anion transporter [Corallococcus interemptor]
MALAIFLFTYIFIAGARLPFVKLDRPGGALLGATLMVVAGAVTPAEVFGHSAARDQQAIDMDTIVLLLGMMLLAVYLAQANFFRAAGAKALKVAHTPKLLLVAVTFVSAVLSAFLVNDTVCLFLTPLVLVVVEDARLPPVPYLLAVCMGSNSGSVATFTGNPQNMLIQGASGLGYARFAAYMALPAVLSTVVVAVALLYMFRKELPSARFDTHPPPLEVDRRLLALGLGSLLGVVVAFFAGLPMSWSALAGGVLVMTLSGHEPREALERVDWVLLLFFASLFVVVHGVNKAGWAEEIRQVFSPLMAGPPWRETLGFAALTLVASNLFSNVPFVMLARAWVPAMHEPELAWHVLALGSTLAGNLTLVGSVANLIVFEAARGKVRMGFMDYLRVGVPVTLISFAVGLGVLLAEHALF